jgi:hypothetical protein
MSPFWIFWLGFSTGAICEYGFAILLDILEKKPLKISHKYTIGKKVSLLSLPIWGLIALFFFHGAAPYVRMFIYASVVGTILEGLMGAAIHKIFGIRIWTYHYGKIGNFTSIYSLPYWGVAGVLFAAIGKMLGV